MERLRKRSHYLIVFNSMSLLFLLLALLIEYTYKIDINPTRYPYPALFIVLINLLAWCQQELRAAKLAAKLAKGE